MYRTEGVLALLVLYVGLAHSFSWDIVVAGENQLEFYDDNGTRTHLEDIPSDTISSLAYDPLHNRVLFAEYSSDDFSISSFDIATKKIRLHFYTSVKSAKVVIAYDPATQLLFWIESGSKSENSILSKPAYTKAKEYLLIKMDGYETVYGITVDSFGGYIYWGRESKIERARFDGSERELLVEKYVSVRGGIAIDSQAQKMYWLDIEECGNKYQMSIESADLNGENRRTLYKQGSIWARHLSYGMVVTKDFIYWRSYATFSQLTKNPPHDKEVEPKQFSLAQGSHPVGMAYNYQIENQTLGIQNCEAQKRPLPINSETSDCASLNVSLLCVHGTKVSGESRCECTLGYIGERCEVSVCHNYCLQGDCSVSAEGQPKCRCNAGYFGERCEVTACSTPTIVTDAASTSTVMDSLNKISQELNNTLKGWRIDMDAMGKFTDDIKSTLRGWREEMEISIQSKLNDSVKYTLSHMKQEMISLRCSDHEKLKECVGTNDVSELKSLVQFQAAQQKELIEQVDTIARHSRRVQNLVRMKSYIMRTFRAALTGHSRRRARQPWQNIFLA